MLKNVKINKKAMLKNVKYFVTRNKSIYFAS